MFDIRAAIYELDEFVDVLPASKITWTAALNDTSTFAVTTHRDPGFLGDQERVDLLDGVFDADRSIVIEVHDRNGAWVQFPHAYGVLLDEDEDAASAIRDVTLEALGTDYDMSGAVNLDASVLNDDGRWQFGEVTPGVYLIQMLTKARGFDLALAIDWDFTATHDSSGRPWPMVVRMAVEPGITPRDLLDSFADQGLVDWRMNGNTLQMFVADSPTGMRRDRTSVELVLGREVLGAPQRRTHRDRVDDVLIVGDEGVRLLESAPRTTRPRGRRALVNKQGGVSLPATMLLLAQSMLAKGDAGRAELTRELRFDGEAEAFPFLDFLPGDLVVASGHRGQHEELRVFQVTITKDQDGVTGSVILADRFLEREVRETRRMNGLLGGSTISGGTNAQPTPPPPVTPEPAPDPVPVGIGNALSVTAVAYLAPSGQALGAIVSTWPAVTVDLDGDPIQIRQYIIDFRPAGNPDPHANWQVAGSAPGSSTGHDFRDPRLLPGTSWDIRVTPQSVEGGVHGAASLLKTVTIPAYAVPPPTLSTPVLRSARGAAIVEHNGLSSTGGAMPADYMQTLVWVTGESTPRVMDRYSRSLAIFDYPPGTTLQIRLQGETFTGIKSLAMSAPAEVTVVSSITGLQAQVNQVEADFAAADLALQGQIDSIAVSASGGIVTWLGATTPFAPAERPHIAGDVWYDTATGTQKRFNGSTWAVFQVGNAGLRNDLDAAKITAGLLDSARLKTDAAWVTNNLLVGNTDEVVVDPTWQNAALRADRARTGWTVAANVVTHTQAVAEDFYFGATSDYSAADPASRMALRAGTRYRVSARVRLTVAGEVSLVARTSSSYDYVTGPVALAANTDHVLTAEHEWGANGGAYGVRLTQPGTIRDVTVRPMLSQVLIQDGLVTAPKIAAWAIEADKIASGAVTASKLHVDALNFKMATGLVVTAGAFQTTATANRGIKLNSVELRAYNASGLSTFSVNASTGDVFHAGDYVSGLGVRAVEIRDALWTDFSGIRFKTDAAGTGAEIKSNYAWWNGFQPGGLHLSSTNLSSPNRSAQLWLDPRYAQLHAINGSTIDSFIQVHQRDSTSGDIVVRARGGIRLTPDNGFLFAENIPAFGGGDIMLSGAAWRVGYQASMREIKHDIRVLTVPPYDLLDVPATTFQDVSEVAEMGAADAPHYVGLIAEDVEAAGVSNPAIAKLSRRKVVPAEQLPAGTYGPPRFKTIATVDYSRLPVLQLLLLKDMARRITTLEQGIELLLKDMARRITALEQGIELILGPPEETIT